MPAWPAAYGGRDASLVQWLLFEEAYWRSGAPARVNQNGIYLLAPTLLERGTPEQRERFLPPMASAEVVWAQGWSEPDAGSDLASLTSRARRDGDEWVLDGQKTWASRGAFADWLFGLFRSEPGSERHRGLSFILLPLDAPGVTVRPIAQLDGEAGFAEVFLDGVRVPVENTVGAPGEGWAVAMSTAGFERGLLLRPPGRFLAASDRLLRLFAERGGEAPPELRERAVRSWMDVEAYRLFTWWTVGRLSDGGSIGADSSVNKIFWSEMDVALHETALDLLGPDGELGTGAAGGWMDGYLFSLAGPIYAGSNEIQRTIIAERVLGLPRSP